MAKKKEINFEEGLERLQEIVESLELGTATLSETLSLYEEGVKLAADLNAKLAEAETRVEVLSAGLNDSLPPDDKTIEELTPDSDPEIDVSEDDEEGALF